MKRASKSSLGEIGIDSKEVYTIPYRGVSAVVHRCPPRPYQSEDRKNVENWAVKHENVVDASWRRFGAILPSGFDTIIRGGDEEVREWLKEDCVRLKEKLEKVKGKVEMGVQILWDRRIIACKVAERSEPIKKLTAEMKKTSEGMAYFYKQQVQQELTREMERLADKYFRDFYLRVKKYTSDIHVERTRKTKEEEMLMNLSVLTTRKKIKPLGRELARIKEIEGFNVRFTGPWPPYSFV